MKLKIGMLDHMNNTFPNTVFQISVDVPLIRIINLKGEGSLCRMKITASVTKSSRQDCGPCYLHLLIFFLSYTLLFCPEISFCDRCFPQQIRPLFSDIYCETILASGLVSV